MRLKICGMKYINNIQQVATLQPDYLGFIFYEKSSRFFNGKLPELPKSIQKVGVFVNASMNDILQKIKEYDLQVVQLHGNETPEVCEVLKIINVAVIKVFSVDDNFDFKILASYEPVCDYFLFDTKGRNPGGNGTTFNWEILKNYPSKKRFFLSGGIGLEEINKIKKLHLPIHALDVNSKFEIQAGLKNIQLLKELQHELSS